MDLQCKKCGRRCVAVVDAAEFAKRAKTTTSVGLVADPVLIIEGLTVLASALAALFNYLGLREQNRRLVAVCKECGYYEKL